VSDLILERRTQADGTVEFYLPNGENGEAGVTALFTPPINSDYWAYRVVVADGQAVVGFPKFGTIGVGFAVEDYDWNTNLPYTTEAEDICQHIWENRGPNIPNTVDEKLRIMQAIELIRTAAKEDRGDH
jgi:hypothetical protein